jgi:general secretion pathway protein D
MKNQSAVQRHQIVRHLGAGALGCWAALAPMAWAAAADEAALNFVGADMESVIKAVGHYTNITFVIDPRVKGTLTLVSEKSISKAQAFSLLTSALRLQGFAVVSGDGYAKVVPEAEAKLQAGPTAVGRGQIRVKGDQIATQIFALSYESAPNLMTVLRPLISPNNTINANLGNNTLVITDYADNLKRLGKIIAALDAPPSGDMDVLPVRYAIASDLAAMVNKMLEAGPGGDSGRISVLADPRTNAVIVRAPSAARANLAKSLIAKLDQPTAQLGNVHVVYLKNADATKLAQTLRSVVSSDTSAPAAAASGTAGGTVATNATNAANAATGIGANQGAGGAAQPAAAPLSAGGGAAGFIQADASTNTLIITASEAVYRNLRAVIDLLDVRRAQVYIESLIVEVTSSKASEFGIQWLGLSGSSTSKYRIGGIQSFGSDANNIGTLASAAAAGTPSLPGTGFTVGIFKQVGKQLGLGALAHALETDGNANILSTPNLITLDNELATIKVGQNVPIITGQFTTAAGGGGATGNPFQTIDRKDVGLTLKVRPQISEGGTIKMAIFHESSSVDQSTLNAAAGVTTNIRVIENNVIADDGQIIVLGGLIEDSASDGVEKVRGLGDIPLFGNLFKNRTRDRKKTNLMVFLRPVVVRSKEQSTSLATDRYDFMRAREIESAPEPTPLLHNGDGPVLPPLQNGQPVGGAMVRPQQPIQPIQPAPAAPDAVAPQR